nr:uncharacterized protein LOC127493217 [Oryctolagus cuniculus]
MGCQCCRRRINQVSHGTSPNLKLLWYCTDIGEEEACLNQPSFANFRCYLPTPWSVYSQLGQRSSDADWWPERVRDPCSVSHSLPGRSPFNTRLGPLMEWPRKSRVPRMARDPLPSPVFLGRLVLLQNTIFYSPAAPPTSPSPLPCPVHLCSSLSAREPWRLSVTSSVPTAGCSPGADAEQPGGILLSRASSLPDPWSFRAHVPLEAKRPSFSGESRSTRRTRAPSARLLSSPHARLCCWGAGAAAHLYSGISPARSTGLLNSPRRPLPRPPIVLLLKRTHPVISRFETWARCVFTPCCEV